MDYKYSNPSLAPTLQEISKMFNSISSDKTALSTELSEVDQRLNDLDHALELLHLDAIGMTQLVKRRKTLVQQRRKIKDEMEFIDALNKAGVNFFSVSDAVRKTAVSIENTRHKHKERTYIPRAEFTTFSNTTYAKNIGKKTPDENKEKIIQKLTYTDQKGRTRKPSKKAVQMEQKFDQISKELHG